MNATLFGFHNSYARLPEHFFARLSPTPVSDPRLVRINEDLAVRLKLDPAFLGSPEGVQILAGNRVPGDAEPLEWHMPDFSLADGCHNWAMGALSCWES